MSDNLLTPGYKIDAVLVGTTFVLGVIGMALGGLWYILAAVGFLLALVFASAAGH